MQIPSIYHKYISIYLLIYHYDIYGVASPSRLKLLGRYQGRWDEIMMADYCCSLERDDPGAEHSRAAIKRKFFPKKFENR